MIPPALDLLKVCGAMLARAPVEHWLAEWFDGLGRQGHHPDSYAVHELPRCGDGSARRFVATLK